MTEVSFIPNTGMVDMPGDTLVVPSEFFLGGGVYNIVLEVQKGTRVSSVSLDVEIVGGKPPLVTVECASESLCFPDETGTVSQL